MAGEQDLVSELIREELEKEYKQDHAIKWEPADVPVPHIVIKDNNFEYRILLLVLLIIILLLRILCCHLRGWPYCRQKEPNPPRPNPFAIPMPAPPPREVRVDPVINTHVAHPYAPLTNDEH